MGVLRLKYLDHEDMLRTLLVDASSQFVLEEVSSRQLRSYGSPWSGKLCQLTTALGSWCVQCSVADFETAVATARTSTSSHVQEV